MPWDSVTEDDVLDELSPQEQALLQSIQGGTSSLDSILDRVVRSARGSIIAGGNQLGPDGTVPDQLRTEILDIARWRWLISVPQLQKLQTLARKDAHDNAKDLLKSVAGGNPKVEVPDNAIVQAGPNNAVSVPRRGARVNRDGFGRMGSS